ncbi:MULTISPECIES: hypothetical protein [Rhodococcus]|uniref:hypothetical protein n=1 Tax=Rhodococcus TaxID=1827 RepID=UPI00064235B3|nr:MULTISPECIES: hypothetical protein [Rhodococcus]NHP18234.1 hypothetical protein [Rhodococcus sp. IC4_135]KLN71406.1 hypothetical protein ABM90_12105 [Rhodococcus erythropolis]KSU61978.1 hypothetical protein AS032_33905 [Rhodococcus qingshengii]MBP2521012.1 hypothetical protein [Rhodococcus sp. PvP104]MBY6389524.1 hypothetical protein [Rhodococcus erythropolis]
MVDAATYLTSVDELMMASTRKNRGGDKDTRAILRALEHAGFLIRYSRSGHPRIYKAGHLITTFPGTASDYRSRRNSLAHLKRAGFVWPPHRRPRTHTPSR